MLSISLIYEYEIRKRKFLFFAGAFSKKSLHNLLLLLSMTTEEKKLVSSAE
jgi:hypothetical protein